jgi:hypothetical protein
MDDFDRSSSGYPSEVDKERYLDSLSTENRQNVEAVSDAFLSQLRKIGRSGALIAVGGTVKPATIGTPRKDVDLFAVIDGSNSFDDWLGRIKAISQEAGIKVSDVQMPIPDKEYNEAFNIHDGSVTLRPNSGVPIEIVNAEVWRNLDQALAGIQSRGFHFSLLVSTED